MSRIDEITRFVCDRHICVLLMMAGVTWQGTAFAANIVPDGSTATSVSTASNGHQLVNLAPAVGGVSHNTYSSFNVSTAGADLNNAGINARTIVNQVTSTNPSLIQGSVNVLGPRANVILGKPRTLGMMAGLEYGPQLVFMIGYHAMAQSQGILAHTINSFAFTRVTMNGRDVGEAGLYGALAHEYGARVALLSGDDVFAEETKPRFPDAAFIVTKQATGYGSGVTQTPERSCAAIREAARDSVARFDGQGVVAQRVTPQPVDIELRVQTTALADLFAQMPSIERVDGVTLRFPVPSVEHAVRTLNCLSAMSFMLR